MSFPPWDTVFSDVAWEQAFWDATTALSPERNDTSPSEFASSVTDDHDSVKDAMQRGFHSSKGKRRRNRKDKEWHAIDRIVKARKEAGKESDVYLDKQLIDPRKLQKNTSRPRFTQPFERYGNTPLPSVPQDFEIRTPQSHDESPTWTQDLPFMQFRNLFRQEEIPQMHLQGLSNQDFDSGLHRTVTSTHYQIVVPKLEALLPASMINVYTAGSSEEKLKVELATRTYFDFLSFSVANNFTGIDGLSPHRILDYLKSQTTTHIARLMQSIAGQTGRALAEKLFTCAIEAEDTSVVEMILQYSQNTKVDANKSVCKYEGNRYTPIERSAGLRDIHPTRVLLKYGADVNKTITKDRASRAADDRWRVGALSCAMYWDIQESTPLELELLQLLLEHGANVKTDHVQKALRQKGLEVLYALFQAGAWENHEEWQKGGLSGRVVEALDDKAATACINLLKQAGADMNESQDITFHRFPTILDVAAKRGNIDMVLMLLHFGAIETERTLSYAIQGQNRAIVDLFLNGGKADSLVWDDTVTTPYAEAIRVQDVRLMQALEQKGSLSNITETRRFRAVLHAALEARNLEVIRLLLNTRSGTMNTFSNTLYNAITANDEEIAIMFCLTGIYGTGAVEEAMKNRNPTIVRALLNFNTHMASNLSQSRALTLAAEWGDISIIEDLLIAGYSINSTMSVFDTPLMIAVAKQDQPLVHFLVNSGAEVNRIVPTPPKGEPKTALSTAVGVQDIDTVNYLLSAGADPGDPAALLKSCEKGGGLLGLLLKAFLMRYPNGQREWYDYALAYAVQNNDTSILETLKPALALKFPGYSQHVGELIGTRLIASNEASIRAIRILLDSGANPDAVVWSENRSERLPLLSAAIEARNAHIVQLLLDKGVDINFPATRGVRFTSVQKAAQTGCYDIVLTLINRGANFDAPAADAGGGTAIQMAAIGGFVGILELLLKKGAKINRAPSIIDGRTALEGAAEWGRLDMVQFLLQSGAQTDGQGRESFLNAMKLAEENGHFVVLGLLQSYSS